MATLLLERRKHAIGNTFLNVQEMDSEQDDAFKLDALWKLPGSCRRRANSVGAIIHADDVVAHLNKGAGCGISAHEQGKMCQVYADVPRIDWTDVDDQDEDDEGELIRAETAPADFLANVCAKRCLGSHASSDPMDASLLQLMKSAALPRLLGRVKPSPLESEVDNTKKLKDDNQRQVSVKRSSSESDEGMWKQHQFTSPCTQTKFHQFPDFPLHHSQVDQEHQMEGQAVAPQQPTSRVPQPQHQPPPRKALPVSLAEGLALQPTAHGAQGTLQPAEEDIQPLEDCENVTTMMIRNVPTDITQQDLLNALNESGFNGLYDFCYMPCCFVTGMGKGFAFLNLISTAAAEIFKEKWHKTRRFNGQSIEGTLNIAPAAVQGLEANVKKWNAPRMKRIRNPNLRPFVVVDQVPQRLPCFLQSSEALDAFISQAEVRSRGEVSSKVPPMQPPGSLQSDSCKIPSNKMHLDARHGHPPGSLQSESCSVRPSNVHQDARYGHPPGVLQSELCSISHSNVHQDDKRGHLPGSLQSDLCCGSRGNVHQDDRCGHPPGSLQSDLCSISRNNKHHDAGYGHLLNAVMEALPFVQDSPATSAACGNAIARSQMAPQRGMQNIALQTNSSSFGQQSLPPPPHFQASADNAALAMLAVSDDAVQAPGVWSVRGGPCRWQKQNEGGSGNAAPAMSASAAAMQAAGPPGSLIPAAPASNPPMAAMLSTRPPFLPPATPAPGCPPWIAASMDAGEAPQGLEGLPVNHAPPPGHWTMVPQRMSPMGIDVPTSSLPNLQELLMQGNPLEARCNPAKYRDLHYQ